MAKDLLETVTTHVEKHIGKISNVLHELISLDVHVDIHIVPPTEKRPFYTLVTSGMSEGPMPMPEELKGQLSPYAELMLCLPKDWKVEARDDERWNWPMKWLWFLAKYPHNYETFLSVSHTIPNGEDCDPFGPGTKQCCWFLRGPQTIAEEAGEIKYGDDTIVLLAMTAIYREEMEFGLSNEMDTLFALDQALAEAGVSELVQPTRAALTMKEMKKHMGKLGRE